MKEANKGIRKAIDDAGLTYWQVAGKIGVHPTTFTVWLRTALDDDKEQKIHQAIDELTLELAEA